MQHALPHLACARLDQLGRHGDGRLRDGGVERRLAELGVDA